MNKNLHRIVFNAKRGLRMVTQETAKSTGKGSSKATTAASAGVLAGAAAFAPMLVGAALAGMLSASPVHAQIVGAPNVPANLRPTVLVAPNGVPLINIQTPSAAGVSRNVFNQFNVAPNGAILNNSRTNVQTQLGGFVQANPYLAGGPARIILNEVNGGSPSRLRGYIEVGGTRAEVIIANPAGISVDGGGFINASRATLTTGTPQFNAVGGLDSFLVRGGTITIDGAGLDASRTDYAAILARAVQANAGIWASELKVVTGANTVSADHSQVTPTSGTGTAPTFALDVAALGGMYAGKITLIGTEAGLGVRNAGTLQAAPGATALAGAGQLVVTSAGRLENIGTIQATADANLAAAALANSGRVASGGNLKITTQGDLANTLNGTGGTLEGARLELASTAGDIDNRGGTIRQTSSTGLALGAPALSNTTGGVIGLEPVAPAPSTPGTGAGGGTGTGTGGTTSPSTPTAGGGTDTGGTFTPAPYVPPSPGIVTAAGTIRNDGGKIYAGGPISLQSANINNNSGTLSVARMAVSQPSFDNHGGTLNVSHGFSANVERFDNTGGTLNAGSLNIAATGDLINTDGTLTSATDATLAVGGQADNTRGTVSATGALTANVAAAVNNTAGTLLANQGVALSAGSLDNTQGRIQSAQAGVQLAVADQLQNSSGGTIGAATDLHVQAGSLVNANGASLRGANDVTVAVGGALTNDGSLTAGRHTTVTAGSLQGSSTGVLGAGIQNDGTPGAAGDLIVTTTGALVAHGTTLAAGNATLQGASVDLSASQTSATNIAITATQGNVTTSQATVSTPGTLSITANAQPGQALVNQGGKLSANQLDLRVSNLANTNGGEIVQTGTGATAIAVSGAIDNSGATLASNGSLALTAASLDNRGGTLRAAQASDLSVDVAGLLDNGQGEISAGGNTTLQAGSLANEAGRVTAAGDVASTTSGATRNRGGTIAANGSTALSAASLDNNGGTVSGLNRLAMNVQGAVDNTAGTLAANQELILSAGALANDKGSIQSTQAAARLNVSNALDNGQGYIGAATDLAVSAGSLSNAGSLRGAHDTTMAVAGLLANDGSITAGRNTTITAGSLQSGSAGVLGAGIQSDGQLGSAGELRVTASGALAAHGTHLAAGNAALQGASVDLSASQTSAANIAITATQGDVTTSQAKVVTPGTLSVTANSHAAQTLVNDAGQLHAKQLDLQLSNLANTNGGEIVQTGTGATTIAMNGILRNDGGRIASNGQDLTLQAASIGNAAGKIEHAGTGTLTIAGGNFSGTSGQITTNGALAVAMNGAFNQDSGTTSARQVTIDAGSLSNRGGQIVQTGADATRITVVGALDNSGGTLASNGNTAVAAGSLVNQGGTIRAAEASGLGLTVGGLLDNSNKGVIGAGGNTTVAAGSLNNNAGSVTAVGDLNATVGGAATNVGGTLAANGNASLVAGTLDNSSGTAAAVNGNLSVTTAGATTNDGGTLQAGAKVTLSNGGLSNLGGKVIGDSLWVDTRGNTLNNTQGTLAATTTVTLNSGALANDAGLIQSGGAMTIATNGQALSNTNAAGYANGQGGITSGDTLALTAGTVNNSAGFIGAKNALTASTQGFSNTGGGVVLGQSTLAIDTHGAGYDNSGGQTLAAGDLGINAGSITNTSGLIRSAATTTLNAGSIANTSTQGTDQGIEGQNVTIGTGNLDNTSGAIRADANTSITSGGTVNNTNGLISAGDTLRIADPNAANPGAKTLNLINTGGTLVADKSVQIDAATFSGDGRLVSGKDLSVALKQDIVNNGEVAANGNLSYTTTGNFTNNGKLLAGQTLTVGGNNVDNTANAEMSGTNTVVNAAGTLTNRGLIDSHGSTQINAGTLNNIGTGRIYGDAISIAAGTLNNDAETVDGATKAGTIAARDTLDIGATTINNREHALIFSAGDMFIGGALDANRYVTGQGGTLNNLSATIESLGSMSISMGQINNWDTHVQLGPQQTTVTGPVQAIAPVGGSRMYTMDEVVIIPGQPFVWARNPDGSTGALLYSNGYGIWTTTSTTTADTAINADPARIVAGGDMTLVGAVYNRDSRIIAGGTLTASNVTNEALKGTSKTDLFATVINDKGQPQPSVILPGSPHTVEVGSYDYIEHANATSGYAIGSAGSGGANAGATGGGSVAGGKGPATIVEVPANVGAVAKTDGQGASSADGASGPNGTTAAPSGNATTNVGAGGTADGAASSAQAGAAGTIPMVVRTSLPDTSIPQASLFRTLPGAGSHYLVETDPRFANYRAWLSSDYLLNSLGLDPNNTLKRLGDGFYEQKLIREQVAQLTGYRYLDGYHNDEEQYTALMNAGATFAKQYGLRPGIALTSAQMAQLTSDIVWLVEQTVTLPDGSTQRVLVPQVYVRVRPGDIDGSGALLTGNQVRIDGKDNNLVNTGTIAGRQLVSINANTIDNLGGRISGGQVGLKAQVDINNIGGTIDARDKLTLEAGRDINVRTTTGTGLLGNTGIDRVAGLYVTNPGGTLVASAGRDVNLIGAVVANTGNGLTSIKAGNDINLGTVTTTSAAYAIGQNLSGGFSQSKEVGTRISGGGDVMLDAGNDVKARAATVAAGGDLGVKAGNDILIESGRQTTDFGFSTQWKDRGILTSTSNSITGQAHTNTAIASSFSGNNIAMESGRDLNIVGSDVSARGDASLTAGRNVNITSALEASSATADRSRTTTGLIVPKPTDHNWDLQRNHSDHAELATQTERASNISAGGNLTVNAGKQVNVYASNLSTGQDLGIQGQEVTILSGTNYNSATVGTSNDRQTAFITGSPVRTGHGGGNANNMTSTREQTTLASSTLNGRNVTITATDGDLTLGAAHINAANAVSLNAPSGAINFDTVTTGTSTSLSRGEHDWAYQRSRDSGSVTTEANYTQINSGTLAVNAQSVNVQVGRNATGGREGSLQYAQTVAQVLQQQSGQPGMNWIQQLQSDPNLANVPINWQGVPLPQRQWAEGQGGLTQTGAAVVAIVATVLTWGAASEVGGAVATSAGEGVALNGGGYFLSGAGAVASATVAAGVSSIASQAAVSLINNNGNISAVLEDLASSRGVRSILASMLSAGVGAAYPASSGLTGVAIQAAVGCATGQLTGQGCAQGAATSGLIAGLQAAGHYLRQDQIRSSQLFEGVVDENGNLLTNTSGSSAGVNGDGIKIGGNRVDVGQLCGVSGICEDFNTDSTGGSNWSSPIDGRVHLRPGISLSSVIATNPGLTPSPLGGLQGGLASINGIPYAQGSFLDNLVESFAGPHDFLNAVHYYDELGNNIQNGASGVWNVVDLLPAMPIGLAALVSQYPDVWQAMVNGYNAERNDEKY